jgi:hypothetical protein
MGDLMFFSTFLDALGIVAVQLFHSKNRRHQPTGVLDERPALGIYRSAGKDPSIRYSVFFPPVRGWMV